MACELGNKGIRVNTLSPGHMYTQCVQMNVNDSGETCDFLFAE
jgi:NAD(P)-dependent dehydrogenase (short-subunit alcohol dehydrogenase family)